MRIPGFTATASLRETPRGATDRTRRAFLAEPAVGPAQIAGDRVTRFLMELRSRDEPLIIWDPPVCPPGQRAVWVDRGAIPKFCYDPVKGIYVCGGQPEFHGWECQSVFRVVA